MNRPAWKFLNFFNRFSLDATRGMQDRPGETQVLGIFGPQDHQLGNLPKFNMVHLKMGGPWNRRFLLETIIFRFHVVKLGEGNKLVIILRWAEGGFGGSPDSWDSPKTSAPYLSPLKKKHQSISSATSPYEVWDHENTIIDSGRTPTMKYALFLWQFTKKYVICTCSSIPIATPTADGKDPAPNESHIHETSLKKGKFCSAYHVVRRNPPRVDFPLPAWPTSFSNCLAKNQPCFSANSFSCFRAHCGRGAHFSMFETRY